jgi:capsular exopolysaccharide synthesis family protein
VVDSYQLSTNDFADYGPTRRSFAQVLWHRKFTILFCMAALIGAGAAYVKYGTPVYEGQARLLLQNVQPPGMKSKIIPHGVDFAATQANVLSSPVVVRDAVTALNNPALDATNVEGLIEIMDSLKVTKIPQTDIVSVRFRHVDPQIAVGLVAKLIEEYQQYLVSDEKLAQQVDQEAKALIAHPSHSTDLGKIEAELIKAQADQKALAEKYGPKHPEMRAANETLAIWEKAWQQHSAAAAAAAASAAATADAQKPEQQKANEDMLAKLGGVKIAILDGPSVSEDAVWPNPLIVLPVAGILGMLLGIGLVVLVDRGDDTIKSASDIESMLGMRPCGIVPAAQGTENVYRWLLESQAEAAKPLRALSLELRGNSNHSEATVVQITSAREASGKTVIAANLALSLAAQGKKVCLVDADMRHGILHSVFDVAPNKGLSSLILDKAELEDVLQVSPLAQVDVLTKGPTVRNPLHLLAQPQLEVAFNSLRMQYDVVIVDTPPLLTLSDASLLAPLADVVLVILRANKSYSASVNRALEMLNSVSAKTVGLVLNGAPVEPWMLELDSDQRDRRRDSRRLFPQAAPTA